ncbi:hypothetical protein [Holdemania massiliensis]|uniref:hypothetical protein n=1 Tax=Holdemania massiliensis TaxID=1468449 RepID=UPI001F05DD03|nr:hypothetical protein [Holdemania massiliensis]MCH1941307.1 hypothetical protein [Holdemania massiliensis]
MFANDKMRENSGRLIKIYRERLHQRSKDKQFSCNEFILATKEHPFYEIIEGAPVCSRATLNRLERGQSIKDDDLYIFFIQKLGFQVDDFPGIMSNVERISEELFDAVEMYDVDRIKGIDQEVEDLFYKAKDYFYYHDVYMLLKTIINYYVDAECPDIQSADFMMELYFISNEKISELLLNILFYIYYYLENKIYKANNVYEILKEKFMNSNISALYMATWLMYKERWISALKITDQALEHYSINNSYFHLGSLYFTKALALHTGNKDNVKLYFDLSIEALEKCKGKLAQKKLVKNYFNIGFHYYFDKDYKTALKYYRKYLTFNQDFTLHILYILHCTEELETDELDDIFKNIKFNNSNRNTVCSVFFEYFQMKIYKRSEKEIENFIMRDIHKILTYEFRSDNLIRYFEYELNNLVKITKCYKDLIYFNDFTSHKID